MRLQFVSESINQSIKKEYLSAAMEMHGLVTVGLNRGSFTRRNSNFFLQLPPALNDNDGKEDA
jgi:hypothetical protein